MAIEGVEGEESLWNNIEAKSTVPAVPPPGLGGKEQADRLSELMGAGPWLSLQLGSSLLFSPSLPSLFLFCFSLETVSH